MPPIRNVRARAAVLLHRVVFGGRSLDAFLTDTQVAERDRPLLQELAIGSVRHYYSLAGEVDARLHTPLKPRDAIVFCLLVIGLYQLRHTRIPSYAAVSETVAATRQVGRPWARALTNQILRSAADQGPIAPITEQARLDHPDWLIEQMRLDHPHDWEHMLRASLSRAPLALRVNQRRIDRGTYLDRLATTGVSAHSGSAPDAVVLEEPMGASQVPGYAEGLVSIQDEGAQWAAELLAPQPRDRVLDACAAPGGKALHLLDRCDGIELVALDQDQARCEQMRTECRRVGADPRIVIQGDAGALTWWDGKPFQRILLDAPCSGTGTLRRHPDIKLLKEASDLPRYHAIQSRLLAGLWRVLQTGGQLLYCTCSVLAEENDRVIDDFVMATPDAMLIPIDAAWGIQTRHGRQLMPQVDGPDGFFYARIEKR